VYLTYCRFRFMGFQSYPLTLDMENDMEREKGFEPSTCSLGSCRSTD
jgi:hypothetical protein